MIKITTIEALRAFLSGRRNDIEEVIQTIIDFFEDIHEIIEELSEILEEKERYSYVFNKVFFILRKVKNKRLWKRQKIP